MTLRHLKIFITVCETGSATAAGEKLFIAQPSISLAISELENHYGVKLFDRISKRLHITETGKHFLQYATHIVDLFESLEREIKNFETMRVLRIGSSITIGNYLLVNYIAEFKKVHPNIDVNVIIDNSSTIQQHVLSNKIDIGLIEGTVCNDYIINQKFYEDELIFICATDHPFVRQQTVELNQIKHEKFLLRENGSGGREIFNSKMNTLGLDIVPAWESTSTQAIINAVRKNLGISVLPYLLVKDLIDHNEIIEFKISNIHLTRNYNIIYHKNKFLTQSAKDFINICK